MSKRDVRLFCGGFFITLIIAGWTAAFLLVDGSSARYEATEMVPALELRQTGELVYDVSVLGQEYWFTLAPLNEVERLRKEYACLVTPRGLLNLEKALDYVEYARRVAYVQYKESEYLQNVMKSQPSVPQS